MTNLTAPRFTDENAAREHLEALRWPEGPFCPHCGSFSAKRLPAQRGRPTKAHPEGAIRAGVVQCNDCRKQYSVTVGTVFESSKIPLHKWVLATYLLTSSKKGMSAHQLHRMLGVTYKTAWFMAHRIREAMRSTPTPMGSDGGIVEVDETFIGRDPDVERKNRLGGHNHKMKVISLVERNTGRAASVVVNDLRATTIGVVLGENLAREAILMTDEYKVYKMYGDSFAAHQTVQHKRGEYVNRDNPAVHTNTIEGYFSIFKRGMIGTYQHCAKVHLHRYLAEFDFRYSNRKAVGVDDAARSDIALKGIAGKRLMYRRTNGQPQAAAAWA